ncbi:hypothetical protein G3480_13210 [Thiorhodococcus mannitoliphagus]|uniref:ATP-binding protein n=1 Tax=Thiorhodococcus mannitoliphagus TaxID=329406 RepID=A0A6P1DW67_9GAMM|nr:hypothetical protein [Thiorhodococcus mannitoliphagus]NEX21261.1 hypothetical protein [Thiorhodococcus mannitoliphagus]
MSTLARSIRIRGVYTRSINLPRDGENLELIQSYLPTSRALQALTQFIEGMERETAGRAQALIGPYGSGKSAFGLFLSALVAPGQSRAHQAALSTLRTHAPALAARLQKALSGSRGFLVIQINGLPDSVVRQLLLALAAAAKKAELNAKLIDDIRAAAQPGYPMDDVLTLIRRVQRLWSDAGGSGLLIEIDELGKFLEYESHHPQHREIHLLQLLAEQAQEPSAAPLHLVVMLHQAFEHYAHRLGKPLREEWQKVQGRFGAIAFLEPAEQALRIVAAAFERDGALSSDLSNQLAQTTEILATEGALPAGLLKAPAQALFARCYPLHPLTLLILPVLCQKVAQNERTLFSYLGSHEPFGFGERLSKLRAGDWIEPWELYDYFILNQSAGFSDPLTYHRWMEVVTALERFDAAPEDDAVKLIKTVGLCNLIGAQRGLKASQPLLALLFGARLDALIERLERASILQFRHYSQEYRVWAGSDFDLRAALQEAVAEQINLPLAETLNQLSPYKPIVARRSTIQTGSLRSFQPTFIARDGWPPQVEDEGALRLWFYLAEEHEEPNLGAIPKKGVVALCRFTDRLRESLVEWIALRELPKRHATLHQDPVAQREHRAWLANAERETSQLIRALLETPGALTWFWGGEERPVSDRRDLQRQLSHWVDTRCYPDAPWIRNELINRDQPSASANTGRKRLLAAMLAAPDQADLGIAKTPAEKSLYLSVLKESGLHRGVEGRYAFYPPPDVGPRPDPCRLRPLWNAITLQLGEAAGRQVGLTEIYANLQRPPFGAKLGPLPVLILAYLLANRRDVALYQEGVFCETLTIDQAELLCRRPGLFSLERFALSGVRGALFDRYIRSVVGQVREDASLLDIARPLVRFIANLPEYSLHCTGVSPETQAVRVAFRQASSPGVLLFEALPAACGLPPTAFASAAEDQVEPFIQTLVKALHELKDAYPSLLERWREQLSLTLLDRDQMGLSDLRAAVAERYSGLDRYTPDRMGLGAFVRRLCDPAQRTDESWLESVATLIGKAPPAKWREETRLQAELRLHELATQMKDLERLRLAMPNESILNGAVLLKRVDAKQGEISRVIQLTADQQQTAASKAASIAEGLANLDETVRLAVVAALFEQMSGNGQTESG